VANLIEYALGFEVDAPSRRVEWHVTRPERHGLKKLRVGPVSVDLVCGPREQSGRPRQVEITADGELTLVLLAGQRRVEARIPPGRTTVSLAE
jgi:hypothetical protein